MADPNFDVLVVEDDAAINALIGAYIELAGMHPRSALDGHSAVMLVKERVPQLVVLDVMLPDTDGFEVCKELRADPRTHDVPVIMLTALTDDASRQRGLACGANEYLNKPFDPDKLMAVLKRLAADNGGFA